MWPFKSPLERERESLALLAVRHRRRLLETATDFYDRYVDPREAWVDEFGDEWTPLAGAGAGAPGGKSRISNPMELDAARRDCRRLAEGNEFAINGHENRVSFIVGSGLKYEFEIPKGSGVSEADKLAAQAWLDAVLDANDWASREQEAVKRGDRDGECLLRTFWTYEEGERFPRFRFVEPEDLKAPDNLANQPGYSWGIQTDPEDVETVLAYFVNGDEVPAEDVTHVKLNVDKSQKRGIPTFYPVRKNLGRAEKLLRNMSAVATLQAAIALIREHEGFGKDSVEDFRDDQDDFTITEERTGKTRHFQKFGPGTIVDAPAGTKYTFPVAGVAADKFVVVLQAELRAIAARLVMPEFMFTSDASNANYASTMVAEGPAVKMFQRLQSFWREHFLAFLWKAIEVAIRVGILPESVRRLELKTQLPSLVVHDEEKEGKTLGREHDAGVLSKRSWAERRGYDFDVEQARLDEEREHSAETMGGLGLTFPPGSSSSSSSGDEEDEGDGDGEGKAAADEE